MAPKTTYAGAYTGAAAAAAAAAAAGTATYNAAPYTAQSSATNKGVCTFYFEMGFALYANMN